jgi:putative addiction module killer protein
MPSPSGWAGSAMPRLRRASWRGWNRPAWAISATPRALGGGVREMRVHVGAGYRVYFAERGDTLLLLWGGDKARQQRDIERAKRIMAELDRG